MKKLVLVLISGCLFSAAAVAADSYERWIELQQRRGVDIEIIRVASEKPLVATEETDEEVAGILEEAEEFDGVASNTEEADDS